MVKEIEFEQKNPQVGHVKGKIRVIGKIVFLRFSNLQHAASLISQMKARGAEIKQGRNWIRVNMFKDKETVRLGDKEFNVNEKSEEEVEEILYNFYLVQYTKAGFKIK